jgi:hypothetical protein
MFDVKSRLQQCSGFFCDCSITTELTKVKIWLPGLPQFCTGGSTALKI